MAGGRCRASTICNQRFTAVSEAYCYYFWADVIQILNIRHLLLQNILTSRIFLSEFISLLSGSRPTFSVHATLPLDSDEVFVTSEPALNFLQLLVRVCQRGEQTPPASSVPLPARTAWLKLMAQYKASSPIIAEAFSNQVHHLVESLNPFL